MAPVAVGGTVLTTGLGSVTVGPEVASELWLFEFDFALVFLPVFVVELPAADFFFLVFLVLVVFCVGEVVLHLGKSRSTSETEAEGSIEAAAEATEADG
jgi:Na+-transporting methylmalonyl-CoA/oxaloacetate decarboxylase gamma subunit